MKEKRILSQGNKYSYIHLLRIILLLTSLHVISLFTFAEETCIETENEFMKSYQMVKNYYMNSNNITNDVYHQYKYIESSLELGEKDNITEEQMEIYKSTKLKLEQTSILNTLFYCIIEKSNFIPEHINDDIPYDSEMFRNCLLQGFQYENKLLSRITNTKTQLGAIMTALNFLRHHNIKQQKDKIQALLSSIEDVQKLETLFNTISECEKDFIKLFSNSDTKRRYGINDYNIYIEMANNIIYRKKTGKLLKVLIICFFYMIVFYFTFIHSFSIKGLKIATHTCSNKQNFNILDKCTTEKGPLVPTQINTIQNMITLGKNKKTIMYLIEGLIGVAHLGLLGYIIFSIKHLFNPSNFYNTLSQKFNNIKAYIESMYSIYNIIKNNPTLHNCFEQEMTSCAQLFDTEEGNMLNGDVIRMIYLLKVIPYDWSYWHEWGRARAKYFCEFFYLFEHNKEFLINAIMEIANIEIYISIINLLIQEDTTGKVWSIVDISDSDKPFLQLEDVWAPIIDKNIAVANNVYFDTKKRFMLIYGMNAGGKTTFIQSIITSLLLSYAYGISPSRKCILTPFKKIFIAIDISTNFEKKQSKFMSELILCDDIISQSKDIENKNFGFIICDELFCGTNPKDSNLFATNFIKFIAQNKNIIGVYATHDENITTLEELYPELYFKNYHMAVKDDLHELKYYYKIKRGIKKQQIALALAADMGRRNLLKNYNILLGKL